MGLAASQARLLTITARKSDCEYQSMSLSHEKIALSRNMEHFSDEYQAALQRTKLVYDYYGTGTGEMPLSYDLFMAPSIYNDYAPKLITNSQNKVVLNSKLAAACAFAGIPAEGYLGTPSSDVRNRFVQGLIDNNVISVTAGQAIQNTTYINDAGLGLSLESTMTTQDISYDQLISLIKANCTSTQAYGLQLSGKIQESSYPDSNNLINRTTWASETFCTYVENSGMSWDRNLDINLYDLLSGKQYTIGLSSGYNEDAHPLSVMAYMQQLIVGYEGSTSFLNWMTDQFQTVLGGTAKSNMAINYAYQQIHDLIYPDESIQNKRYGPKDEYNPGSGTYKYVLEVMEKNASNVQHCYDDYKNQSTADNAHNGHQATVLDATNYFGFTYTKSDKVRKMWHSASISLTNLAQAFLTSYVEYMEGVENCNYFYDLKTSKSNAVLYDPNKSKFKFTVPGEAQSNADGEENTTMLSQYYDTLLNQICTRGWTENDKIEDSSYLQELLKNGSIYIASQSNDNIYYQNSYTTDVYIKEIADTEYVAQAEAKYNAEKVRIESKENQIDMKLKNLDTEISALSTEYDTIKSLISKTIEKSLKRYEA